MVEIVFVHITDDLLNIIVDFDRAGGGRCGSLVLDVEFVLDDVEVDLPLQLRELRLDQEKGFGLVLFLKARNIAVKVLALLPLPQFAGYY